MTDYEIAIIGGGCVGFSIAKHLAETSARNICLLEKEYNLAQHQSGRNSGVLHPGLNYEPGSLKAKFSTKGTKRMKEFCKEHEIPLEEYGVQVVATNDRECEQLEHLQEQADRNGVQTQMLESQAEIQEMEPHTTGQAALYSPEAASADAQKYVYTLAKQAENKGVDLFLGYAVRGISETADGFRLETSNGELTAEFLVNAAGLYADKIAHELDIGLDYQVIPFRGIYYELVPEKQHLVNSMIYPTPDPNYPFLGVHYTRRTDDKVLVGPNAAIAFGREAYDTNSVQWREFVEILTYSGFWRMMNSRSMILAAWNELNKTYSKKKFVEASKKLLPKVKAKDLTKSYTGIRAQIIRRDGTLISDPIIKGDQQSIHVLNAVSPGFTSSLPFGEYVSEQVLEYI